MTRIESYFTIGFTTLLAAGMSACIMDPDPLPEMPYRPRKVTETAPQPEEHPVETTSWESAPSASGFITPAESLPASLPQKPSTETPVEKTAATAPSSTPQPEQVPAKVKPTPEPQIIQLPAVSSTPSATEPKVETPAPTPSPAATPVVDLKQITNTGPIPTAARVEGDPTRVWNPLDPSKKIRIINPKTNQPYPSGKKLKVRGTNFQFYVP